MGRAPVGTISWAAGAARPARPCRIGRVRPPMPPPPDPPDGASDPEFFARLPGQLWRLWRFYQGAGLEFEDLVQEVWVRVFASPPPRGERNAREYCEYRLAFASTCAKRLLIDAARRTRPQTNVDLAVVRDGAHHQLELDDLWEAVRRAADATPDPPPRAFVREWFDLVRAGKPVTEDQVLEWQQRFAKSRTTIYRWTDVVKTEVEERVVRPGREERP